MEDVDPAAGRPGLLDEVLDGEVLGLPRPRGEEVGVCASAGVRGVVDLVGVLGVDDEQPVERGDLAHRRLDLGRGQRGELVDARVQQEALEPEHAGVVQRPQVGEVAGHGTAPEPHVHPRLAVGRLALDLQRRDVDGRRDAVERHVDDGRDPAGGGRLGRGLEALPLGAPRVVDVDVGVDDARAAAPRRRPARRRLPRARRGPTPAASIATMRPSLTATSAPRSPSGRTARSARTSRSYSLMVSLPSQHRRS